MRLVDKQHPNAGAVVEDVIRRRRVTRVFRAGPLDPQQLVRLAEAVYWAPSGGNRKPVRVVIVRGSEQLLQVVAVSPGIIGEPSALLVLCIDWGRSPHLEVDDARDTHSSHVDVGAAMENALLWAEAMDLGACPVMSFHRQSVKTILGLPEDWTPLVIVALGLRPQQVRSGRGARPVREVIFWDRYGRTEPDA